VTDPDGRVQQAEVLVATGVVSMQMGHGDDALTTLDRVLAEYPDATEPVAVALSYKAEYLMRLRRLDDAFGTCQELLGRHHGPVGDRVALCIANTLLTQGIIEIQRRRPTHAIGALDEFRRRFGDSTEAYYRQRLAAVLYNLGIALRDAGRLADAVPVFTEAVEQFAESDEPGLRRFAAMALYNRAIAQARLLDPSACSASTAEMGRRFGGSDDPVVVERLAKVRYHHGVMRGLLGTHEEAIADFRHIVQGFAREQAPVIQAIVAGARRRALFSATMAPSEHSTSNAMVQTDLREWETDVRDATPAARPNVERRLKEYREMIGEEVKKRSASHGQASAILRRYLFEGEPFGLFLRSFGLENEVRIGADVIGTPARMALLRVGGDAEAAGEIERQVATAFQDRLQFFAVGHNVPLALSQYAHHLPKLEVPNEIWQPVLEELASAAEIIITHVELLSPGVVEELRAIRRLGKDTRTIVVLSTPSDSTLTTRGFVQIAYNAGAAGPLASADHGEIRPFPWIVHAAELTAHPLKEWDLVHGLLVRIDAIRQQDPGVRARWDGVTF
jgi:tetratricopeptide (TPR) repeat protein